MAWPPFLAVVAPLAALLFFRERAAFFAIRTLILLGFSRHDRGLRGPNRVREALLRFIVDHPGRSFSDLKREFGISNGTLVHHLHFLEQDGRVERVPAGIRLRFFAAGTATESFPYMDATDRRILEALRIRPDSSQRDLTEATGIARSTLSYRLIHLERRRLLSIGRMGATKRYKAGCVDANSLGPNPSNA